MRQKLDAARSLALGTEASTERMARLRELLGELSSLLDIALQGTGTVSSGADQLVQTALEKTLNRLVHVEAKARVADADSRGLKSECDNLTEALKQQRQETSTLRRLLQEASECSERNASSAKEWRSRAQELEGELATAQADANKLDSIMTKLRGLYVRYTELSAQYREKDAETSAREAMYQTQLAAQKKTFEEQCRSLRTENEALRKQLSLLGRLESGYNGPSIPQDVATQSLQAELHTPEESEQERVIFLNDVKKATPRQQQSRYTLREPEQPLQSLQSLPSQSKASPIMDEEFFMQVQRLLSEKLAANTPKAGQASSRTSSTGSRRTSRALALTQAETETEVLTNALKQGKASTAETPKRVMVVLPNGDRKHRERRRSRSSVPLDESLPAPSEVGILERSDEEPLSYTYAELMNLRQRMRMLESRSSGE
ncbi:hypothetical protein GMRT_10539 [Giardia muris]|uniref:Uncharacterized protein n=1 Tax=Giardia muris TaxID=5742 RepID=A0A4Z1T3A1_GIAMU|nr:hypothetical protein GMRT_10539 [Giardia muris]|eukprot:TNJ26881.1 hypothetical protein GMRT_10539 [Giardia muris]